MEQMRCIALRTVRYNDRHSILGVYTPTRGRLSLLVPASNTKGALRIKAITMPMSIFDCVVDIRNNRDVFNAKDFRPISSLAATANPVRGAIGLFAADMLSALLREPAADERLFDFLANATDVLMNAHGTALANFPLTLMMRLCVMLGIEPDWSTYSSGSVFDMADGIFRESAPMHGRFLAADDAHAAWQLRRLNFRTARCYAMNRADRNRALDIALTYYRQHFPSLGVMNSIEVLRHLFDF